MIIDSTNMAKNYSHCPLKKRPVFIVSEEIGKFRVKNKYGWCLMEICRECSFIASVNIDKVFARLTVGFFFADEPENLSTKPEDLRITGRSVSPPPSVTPPSSPPSSPASIVYPTKPEATYPYRPPISPDPIHYAPNTWTNSVAAMYSPSYFPMHYYPDYPGPPSPYYSSESSCSPPHIIPRQPLAPLALRPVRYSPMDQASLSPTSSTTSPPPNVAEDLSENVKRRQATRHQCPDCGKSYSTFSGLSKHRQFHCAAGDGPRKSFSCKYCEKVYVSLGALKMHIRTHTLPCKCNLCGKAFSRPWLLQGHIRTHTGEKPFSCQHCHRAFADRSNLRAHLQTHSDVKKYSCTSCSKTFSRMSLLTKHVESGCNGQPLSHPEMKMY